MKTITRLTLLLLALLTLLSLVACADIDKTGAWETATYDRDTELGEGAKTVTVKVIADEQELTFTIHTDKETLGDALLEHKLIDGEQGPFGLYIKAVNGIIADYDVDLVQGRYIIDAKSIMGIFSLDLLSPITVVAHTEKAAEFFDSIASFKAE